MEQNLYSSHSQLTPATALPDVAEGALTTDAVIAAAGLRKVTAYVRESESANAIRVRRAREKIAAVGITQINVRAPKELQQTVKDLASALSDTGNARQALETLLTAEVNASTPGSALLVASQRQIEAYQVFVQRLTGWRLFLARLLGLI